jgi:hypothetical protein
MVLMVFYLFEQRRLADPLDVRVDEMVHCHNDNFTTLVQFSELVNMVQRESLKFRKPVYLFIRNFILLMIESQYAQLSITILLQLDAFCFGTAL